MRAVKNRLITILHDRIKEIDSELSFLKKDVLLFPDENPDESKNQKLSKEREWCGEMIKVIFKFRRSSFYKEDSQDMLLIGKIDIAKVKGEGEKKFIGQMKENVLKYGHRLLISEKQRKWLEAIRQKYEL